MADKLPFGEGASINRPPLFCGVNYQFWKVIMKIFMHSTNKGIYGKQLKMVPLYLKSKEMRFQLINLHLIGLRLKVKKPNLTGLLRI